MAPSPVATTTPAPGFQATFKRVAQSNDCDCAFACIAMIANKPLAEVRQAAIDHFKHPAHGPFWIGEDLIIKLFAHYSWVATFYKEVSTIAELPDLGVLMVGYNPETEIGRHVLFHRQKGAAGKPTVEYIIDPAFWIDPVYQIRTDVKSLPAAYYIGIHQMSKGK